jgi:hypothetical protein
MLKSRRVPTETGFKLRVALPSSQQSKGYASVNFEWTPFVAQKMPREVIRSETTQGSKWCI